MAEPSGGLRRATLATAGLLVALGSVVVPNNPAGASTPTPAFRPMPCPEGVFPSTVTVDCGLVSVPENRTAPGTRSIEVAAAVVKARSPQPLPDPIVFLDGGPSFGAISGFALDFYFRGSRFPRDRDLILVDTRGTGLSQPRLGCPELDEASVEAWYSKPYLDSAYNEIYMRAVQACRDRLVGDGVDLTAYNSAEGAADLDDLRRALGYDDWNLWAFSADGVLGLTYMRLFPDHIRSVVLDSPVSPQHLGRLDAMRGQRELLEKMFAGCAANATCDAAYPGLRDGFFEYVNRLWQQPVVAPIPDYLPEPVTVLVDGSVAYGVVTGAYPGDKWNPETISRMLSDTWRSINGETADVMREYFGTGPFEDSTDDFFAQGKTLSYLCRDVDGFITPRDLQRAAADLPELAPVILDPAFGLPIGPAGCRIWNVGRADPVQHRPVSSHIPTLILIGEYDPAVPPFVSRQIPATLPNSFTYEFPAGAHGQIAIYNFAEKCARSITSQFLAAPHREPDSSCLAELAPFDFTPPDLTHVRDAQAHRSSLP